MSAADDEGVRSPRLAEVTTIEAKLDALLTTVQAEADRRIAPSPSLSPRRLATIVTVIAGVLGGGGYFAIDAVAPTSTDAKIERLESDIHKLKRDVRRSHQAFVGGVDFLARKIDAAHPDARPVGEDAEILGTWRLEQRLVREDDDDDVNGSDDDSQ